MDNVDDAPEGTGCAGAAVAVVVVGGFASLMWAITPTYSVLALWAVGWGAIIWAAKHVPHTPDPAPPPPPEGVVEEKPQVTLMRDPSHPNRWLTVSPSRWLGYRFDKRDES